VLAPDRRPAWVSERLPLLHFAVDSVIWCVAVPLTMLLRYDFHPSRMDPIGVLEAAAIAVAGQGLFGYVGGLYRRRWRYGSFDELFALAATVLACGTVLTLMVWITSPLGVPRSVPPLATFVMFTGAVSLRSLWRLYNERGRRPTSGEPLIVIGAGEGAYQIVRALLTDPAGRYAPVALLDDDIHKRSLRIQGVRVEGTLDDLEPVAKRLGASSVLMAIPTADSSLIQHMAGVAASLGLKFLVLPRAEQMLGTVSMSDIRPVTREDLLGRHTADIDPAAVSDYITAKTVLVTGAGGSIGSELCRQLHRYGPARLIMLDRDESGLHGVQLSIHQRVMLDDPDLVLADIRDAGRLEDVFARFRPDVVFHAAALKHLSMLEAHPDEGWKTNVLGTRNVLEAAARCGVGRVVNISTDKAANPTSILGHTKRLTERLTASYAEQCDGSFVSVRFGNVLGSRGSVLTTFAAQSEAGGPITVTDSEVTRYFMTVEEAVRLTIYAGAIGRSGEVLVLDMGKPVAIVDVAKRFASQADPPLKIVFTGLRPGEKLHEELFGDDETDTRPVHRLISHVRVPSLPVENIADVPEELLAAESPALWDALSTPPSSPS
jgi:FlaA1/EpsC-like NDP-sugar epimerase